MITVALCCLAIVIVLIILSFFVPIYGDVCGKSEYSGQKECTPYHLPLYILWCIEKALDAGGVAITAVATIAIGGFTYQLKRATDRLWEAGEKQIAVAKLSADAAKANADAALVALRPWLSCKVEVAGPLEFDSKGDAHIKFRFIVKNVGKAPALEVQFLPALRLFATTQEAPYVALNRMAANFRAMPVSSDHNLVLPSGENIKMAASGKVIFQEDSEIYPYNLLIPRADIEKSCEDILPNTYFWPVVIGVVTYSYPLAVERASTGFALDVTRVGGQFTLGVNVPKNKIYVDREAFGGGFAS